MSTAVIAPALRPAPAPTLDDRLALAHLAMDARLATASGDMLIRTAHIPIPDLEIGPPILTTPAAEPAPSGLATAELLRAARQVIVDRGWTTGRRRDEAGAVCLIGALHTAAGSGSITDAAAALLDAIQAEWADAQTVPSWNDQQRGPDQPLRMLERAARLAQTRGL